MLQYRHNCPPENEVVVFITFDLKNKLKKTTVTIAFE